MILRAEHRQPMAVSRRAPPPPPWTQMNEVGSSPHKHTPTSTHGHAHFCLTVQRLSSDEVGGANIIQGGAVEVK